jgi:hypothetical protein
MHRRSHVKEKPRKSHVKASKVGWVKDEADRARAEEMVAAVVEAMKARMPF